MGKSPNTRGDEVKNRKRKYNSPWNTTREFRKAYGEKLPPCFFGCPIVTDRRRNIVYDEWSVDKDTGLATMVKKTRNKDIILSELGPKWWYVSDEDGNNDREFDDYYDAVKYVKEVMNGR